MSQSLRQMWKLQMSVPYWWLTFRSMEICDSRYHYLVTVMSLESCTTSVNHRRDSGTQCMRAGWPRKWSFSTTKAGSKIITPVSEFGGIWNIDHQFNFKARCVLLSYKYSKPRSVLFNFFFLFGVIRFTCFCFCFDGSRDWQDLVHARLVLYHWAILSS